MRECEVVGLQQQEVALQVVEVDLPVLEREQLALGENLELSLGLVMRVLPEVVPVARDRGDRNLDVVRVDDEAAVDLGVVRWQGRAVALRQRVAALRTRADWGISCNLYALPPRTHRPPCTRPRPGLSSAARSRRRHQVERPLLDGGVLRALAGGVAGMPRPRKIASTCSIASAAAEGIDRQDRQARDIHARRRRPRDGSALAAAGAGATDSGAETSASLRCSRSRSSSGW